MIITINKFKQLITESMGDISSNEIKNERFNKEFINSLNNIFVAEPKTGADWAGIFAWKISGNVSDGYFIVKDENASYWDVSFNLIHRFDDENDEVQQKIITSLNSSDTKDVNKFLNIAKSYINTEIVENVNNNIRDEFIQKLAKIRDRLHDFGVDYDDRKHGTKELYQDITGITLPTDNWTAQDINWDSLTENTREEIFRLNKLYNTVSNKKYTDMSWNELPTDIQNDIIEIYNEDEFYLYSWDEFNRYWDIIEDTATKLSDEKMQEILNNHSEDFNYTDDDDDDDDVNENFDTVSAIGKIIKNITIELDLKHSMHSMERQGRSSEYIKNSDIKDTVDKATEKMIDLLIDNTLNIGDAVLIFNSKNNLNVVGSLISNRNTDVITFKVITCMISDNFYNKNKTYKITV